MDLIWFGAAGFRIKTRGQAFLIDPYLSRNSAARPVLPCTPADLAGAEAIFLSHGHFDHAADVPQIARQTGATVYCSDAVAATLERHGTDPTLITCARQGDVFECGAYQATCFNSTHVRFDLSLIATTIWRSLPSSGLLLPLLRQWPSGQVLAWRFRLVEEGDRIVQHFGSAGCRQDEMSRMEELPDPDVLLVPLQGHSRICQIAAHIVDQLQPRIVVPHHHDDFCPPISQQVDIAPFAQYVGAKSPSIEIAELPIGVPVAL